MTIFGLDISNNNPSFPVADIKRQGYEFLMCKLTEGDSFYDGTFEEYRAAAEAAGLLFVAYHALHHGNPVGQADWFCQHLTDKSIPAMIDFEPFGDNPTKADALAFKKRCESHGVRVTLNYHPAWYWQQIGRPWLLRLPRTVASAYPSKAHLHGSSLYPGDQGEGWARYGGRRPVIWQFASTALVDGYNGNVDVNAFRGTRDELAALGLFKDYAPTPAPHPHPKPPTVKPPVPAPGPEPRPKQRHPWWRIKHLEARVARLRAVVARLRRKK